MDINWLFLIYIYMYEVELNIGNEIYKLTAFKLIKTVI